MTSHSGNTIIDSAAYGADALAAGGRGIGELMNFALHGEAGTALSVLALIVTAAVAWHHRDFIERAYDKRKDFVHGIKNPAATAKLHFDRHKHGYAKKAIVATLLTGTFLGAAGALNKATWTERDPSYTYMESLGDVSVASLKAGGNLARFAWRNTGGLIFGGGETQESRMREATDPAKHHFTPSISIPLNNQQP